MELADPTERMFFIRESGAVPFGDVPADVYEYEYAEGKCRIRHEKGKKAYSYGRVRVKEVRPVEMKDPQRTIVRRNGRTFDNVERNCGL